CSSDLVAHVDDVDAALDRDGTRQLTDLERIQRGLECRLYRTLNHPAGVTATSGRRGGGELTGHGHEGGALNHLGDQLLGAVHGGLLSTDAVRFQIDLADQVLGLGRGLGGLAHGLSDLGAADTGAAVEAAADKVAPTDFGAQLFTEGLRADAALRQELEVVLRRGADFLGHARDFAVDLFVGDLQGLVVRDFLGL